MLFSLRSQVSHLHRKLDKTYSRGAVISTTPETMYKQEVIIPYTLLVGSALVIVIIKYTPIRL